MLLVCRILHPCTEKLVRKHKSFGDRSMVVRTHPQGRTLFMLARGGSDAYNVVFPRLWGSGRLTRLSSSKYVLVPSGGKECHSCLGSGKGRQRSVTALHGRCQSRYGVFRSMSRSFGELQLCVWSLVIPWAPWALCSVLSLCDFCSYVVGSRGSQNLPNEFPLNDRLIIKNDCD